MSARNAVCSLDVGKNMNFQTLPAVSRVVGVAASPFPVLTCCSRMGSPPAFVFFCVENFIYVSQVDRTVGPYSQRFASFMIFLCF